MNGGTQIFRIWRAKVLIGGPGKAGIGPVFGPKARLGYDGA
jgi:hypothetical protein